jgi:hypothetical protein
MVLTKITTKHEHSSIVMGVAAYHGLVVLCIQCVFPVPRHREEWVNVNDFKLILN